MAIRSANDVLEKFTKAVITAQGVLDTLNSGPYISLVLTENKKLFAAFKPRITPALKEAHRGEFLLDLLYTDVEELVRRLEKATNSKRFTNAQHNSKCRDQLSYVVRRMNQLTLALFEQKASLDGFLEDGAKALPIESTTPLDNEEEAIEEDEKLEPSPHIPSQYDPFVGEGEAAEQCRLADRLLFGIGAIHHPGNALRAYKNAASKGSIRAHTAIGDVLSRGTDGLAKNEKEAVAWYEKAGEEPVALCRLGVMAAKGKAIPQNYAQAYKYFTKAKTNLHDPLAAAEAANQLGYMWEHGLGMKQDYKKALEEYLFAAAAGCPQAQNNLGAMYFAGHGVEASASSAVEWWKKAALEGNAAAMNHLGWMNESGNSLPVDLE